MKRLITISITHKQLEMIILAVEEQHDAQVDEVRDAKPHQRKKAERELADWGQLFLNLQGVRP